MKKRCGDVDLCDVSRQCDRLTVKDLEKAIEPRMLYQKQFATVLNRRMAYVDTGHGEPLVFMHGNVTSSYMWRNIIPYVEGMARCIAIDNIGQGDSEKLPNSGPGSYRLSEHQRYIDALLDQLALGDKITLMLHDWGGSLGFTWAKRNRKRVKAIAYMQTLMGNQHWDYWPTHVAELMRRFRSPEGEVLVLEQNHFVEKVLPGMTLRRLPDEIWNEYRRPYLKPGEGRRATLSWPREIPVEGEPADVLAAIDDYVAWLKIDPIPKLFINAEPGAVLTGHLRDLVRTFPNQIEATVRGLHYIHEDSPHEIGEALAGWYRSLV
jgi:haloalkane dehalogenase